MRDWNNFWSCYLLTRYSTVISSVKWAVISTYWNDIMSDITVEMLSRYLLVSNVFFSAWESKPCLSWFRVWLWSPKSFQRTFSICKACRWKGKKQALLKFVCASLSSVERRDLVVQENYLNFLLLDNNHSDFKRVFLRLNHEVAGAENYLER